MNSIEFGKICRPYNVKYREIFGYVSCRDDYSCSQEEYYEALQMSVEKKIELQRLIVKRKKDVYTEYNKRY